MTHAFEDLSYQKGDDGIVFDNQDTQSFHGFTLPCGRSRPGVRSVPEFESGWCDAPSGKRRAETAGRVRPGERGGRA
jgi:hypothetical protein